MKRKRQVRSLSNHEKNLIRALHLKNARQLDALMRRPVSQYAASHSEPTDEAYELLEKAYQEEDQQWDAQQRFDSLYESKYVN